jgi:hypothetical protein
MHFPNLLPAKRLEQGIIAIVRMKPGRNEGNSFHAIPFQQGKHNLIMVAWPIIKGQDHRTLWGLSSSREMV